MVVHDKLHLEARVCACKCFYAAGCDMPAAIVIFQEEWNDSHPEHRIADVRAFIQKSVSKLENNGDLHDAGGQGRHHKLSDDDARTCADIISAGYLQEQKLTDHGVSLVWYEHKQYTSLSEALTESDALRALTTDKGLSEDYVKGRLHDVAPYLIYGPLPMKMPLTHAQMAARVRYCKRMLKRLVQDPDFLMKVFWVDECRIWFNKDLAGRLMVWFDRRKVYGQPPESNMWFDIHISKRIDFLLILNAKMGFVYMEFLTGTTDLDTKLRHNQVMRDHVAARGRFRNYWPEGPKAGAPPDNGHYRVSHM